MFLCERVCSSMCMCVLVCDCMSRVRVEEGVRQGDWSEVSEGRWKAE